MHTHTHTHVGHVHTPSGAGSISFLFILTLILRSVSPLRRTTSAAQVSSIRVVLVTGPEDFDQGTAPWILTDVKGKSGGGLAGRRLCGEPPELSCLTLSAVCPSGVSLWAGLHPPSVF